MTPYEAMVEAMCDCLDEAEIRRMLRHPLKNYLTGEEMLYRFKYKGKG